MRLQRVIITTLILIAVVRVALTWTTFSQTADEPAHIAAGFQWLQSGKYDLEPEHPPLARIAFAIGPWLRGASTNADAKLVEQGNAVLGASGRYVKNLALARAGNLVFHLLGLAILALWAYRLFGAVAAIVAVGLYGSLPPVLAHAGLATTDIAGTSTLLFAMFAFAQWLRRPAWTTACLAGAAIGIALAAKFSFIAFFPVSSVILLAAHWLLVRRPVVAMRHVAVIAVIAAFVVVAAYRFSFGTINEARLKTYPSIVPEYTAAKRAATEPSPSAWEWMSVHVPVPAPLFFTGAKLVEIHSRFGHPAFLLGERSDKGWWYYFPVVSLFKTPLAFLLLSIAGVALLIRRARISRNPEELSIALWPIAIMCIAMTSSINIGVRHVLPMYPFLAIAAGFAVSTIWSTRNVVLRAIAVVLLTWHVWVTTDAHPDYLAYFNELAGDSPESIALDSNLDWGQDLLRLAGWTKRENVDHVYVSYFGSADWKQHGIRGEELPRGREVKGWIAVSEMNLQFGGATNRGDGLEWLRERRPTGRIGKSIRLYFIP